MFLDAGHSYNELDPGAIVFDSLRSELSVEEEEKEVKEEEEEGEKTSAGLELRIDGTAQFHSK